MDFPLVFYSICTNFAPTEQPAFSISLQTANSEKNQNRKKERLPAHASHTETRGLWPYQHLARDCRPANITVIVIFSFSLLDSLWEPQTHRLAVGKHTVQQP